VDKVHNSAAVVNDELVDIRPAPLYLAHGTP